MSTPRIATSYPVDTSIDKAIASPIRQNWVLQPSLDFLMIIAAPILALGAALLAFRVRGSEAATSGIILFHVIATVAHHLPTFIRIYGDVELFERFKWSFILGPLIPFCSALGVLVYINYKGLPLESFFYLFIVLLLWDPWHFFMQHFGFMRIYDRPNSAPRRIAARLDFSLCACWFAYTLIASSDWLADLLIGFYQHSGVPLMLSFTVDALAVVQQIGFMVTLLMTAIYVAYTIWCYRRGYYVSWAKLALSVVTFSVMFVAYTPNALIKALAPGWSFRVGFAVIGIVHVTQYLAIVWRYNRNLARREGRARPGIFRALHGRGGWAMALLYVGVCFGYGAAVTTVHQNRWFMGIMLAIGFTSTLMHYYYDGFIWKLRHAQNRANLAMDEPPKTNDAGTPGTEVSSWWTTFTSTPVRAVFFRQCIYFGLPIAGLTILAQAAWQQPPEDYHVHMRRANDANKAGLRDETKKEIETTLIAMERELPIATKIAELKPSSANSAALAFLIYWHAQYRLKVVPELEGQFPAPEQQSELVDQIARATQELERAVALGGSLGHPGRESLTVEDASVALRRWQGEITALRSSSETAQPVRLMNQ